MTAWQKLRPAAGKSAWLLLLLASWLAANYWWWRALPGPDHTQAEVQGMPLPQAVQLLAGQAWFGQAQVAMQAAPTIQLLGLLGGQAGSPDDFALVSEDGVSKTLRLGQSTASGWQLQQILASGIVLVRDGQRHELLLTRNAISAGGVLSPEVVTAASPGKPAMAPQQTSQPPVAVPPATLLQD